jgi:rhodanese-related sulfurtransferase
MQTLQALELSAYLEDSEPLLVDVREPWEFEICHLPGSINIPMGQVAQQLETIRSAQECIMICHHGVRSRQVIAYLQQQDIRHMINLEGGVDAWAREVDNSMPLY